MRKLAASALIGVLLMSSSVYAGVYKHDVETHPSQGAVRTIQGATAQLITSDKGIAAVLDTKELTPGHVVTLWVAIINKPEACAQAPCKAPDVLKNTAATHSDVTYGDGIIVGPDGTATFRTFIPAGKLSYSWFGNGLENPQGAEIHYVLNDHGPIIPEMAQSMITTSRGGCTSESLPKLWPASAKASGTPGPNKCRMVQDVIFQQE
jgi:hypothetical protein